MTTLSCVDNAIKTLRQALMKITGLANNYIINGESIRGAELVIVKNGKKVPIGIDETCIVTYLDPTSELSVVDSEKEPTIIQSYEWHLIIYGNCCRKVVQKIKTNFYLGTILDDLRENGISILRISEPTNTSEFITTDTYMLRSDLRINFNCTFVDENVEEDNKIENIEFETQKC